MNKRRKLVIALGVGPLSWAGALFSQSKKALVVIGWLSIGSRATSRSTLAAFKEGLAALGWKEGLNYVLEERWADGGVDRLPGLAEELAAKKPAIIISSRATIAAAKAAPKIPIVQALGDSPVDLGVAVSLARPGGMVTGVTSLSVDISEKYLELLLDAAPQLKRVGFLVNPNSAHYAAYIRNAGRAAKHERVETRFAEVGKAEEIEPAIARFAKDGVDGLIVLPGNLGLFRESTRIIKLALAQRWPTIAPGGGWVRRGALLSYSADVRGQYRRAAYYVDRILNGAKPSDLPIEQPMAFELVVNLKTAKALGLTMPREIMVQATQVIQ